MKNKISKIILITSLLASGITTAQEFYTCVPKKDWWDNLIKRNTINEEKIQKIIRETQRWKKIDYKANGGVLYSGKYRIIGAGAGGPEEVQEFTINDTIEIGEICIGKSGKDIFSGYGGGITICENYAKKESYPLTISNLCYVTESSRGRGGKGKVSGCPGSTAVGGGGGGSYAKIRNKEFIFSGGNGMSYSKGGKGAGPDGYVIIEKYE